MGDGGATTHTGPAFVGVGVTVERVWPLGQVVGAGVVSVGRAIATGMEPARITAVTRAAAQPRTGLRGGRAVDMFGAAYGIVLREFGELYTPQRPSDRPQ
jgi:hypothetical protein